MLCYAGQSTLQSRNNLKTWHNTFTYTELEPYFSDYGRCLLIEKKNNCSPRYQFQAAPGIWKIPLAHGNQLLLIVAAYQPYYMDGMGDTLTAAVVYDQETSFQWLGVSNKLRTLISDEQQEKTNDTAPLFVGTFEYTPLGEEKTAIRLGFFTNGQWKPISLNIGNGNLLKVIEDVDTSIGMQDMLDTQAKKKQLNQQLKIAKKIMEKTNVGTRYFDGTCALQFEKIHAIIH